MTVRVTSLLPSVYIQIYLALETYLLVRGVCRPAGSQRVRLDVNQLLLSSAIFESRTQLFSVGVRIRSCKSVVLQQGERIAFLTQICRVLK